MQKTKGLKMITNEEFRASVFCRVHWFCEHIL